MGESEWVRVCGCICVGELVRVSLRVCVGACVNVCVFGRMCVCGCV